MLILHHHPIFHVKKTIKSWHIQVLALLHELMLALPMLNFINISYKNILSGNLNFHTVDILDSVKRYNVLPEISVSASGFITDISVVYGHIKLIQRHWGPRYDFIEITLKMLYLLNPRSVDGKLKLTHASSRTWWPFTIILTNNLICIGTSGIKVESRTACVPANSRSSS